MKGLRLLILGITLFAAQFINAQSLSINAGALSVIPPTVPLDSSPVFSVTSNIVISDTSSVDYIGKIRFGISVNGTLIANPDTNFSYTPLDSDFISAHGFITKSLTIRFTSPTQGGVFLVGPAVVVIWPIDSAPTPHAHIVDSATASFTITGLAGINDPSLNNVKAYMINSELLIQSDAENTLERVRIFDVSGAVLLDRPAYQNTTIQMDQFASGIYLAEVTLADNRRQIFKVFKSN